MVGAVVAPRRLVRGTTAEVLVAVAATDHDHPGCHGEGVDRDGGAASESVLRLRRRHLADGRRGHLDTGQETHVTRVTSN